MNSCKLLLYPRGISSKKNMTYFRHVMRCKDGIGVQCLAEQKVCEREEGNVQDGSSGSIARAFSHIKAPIKIKVINKLYTTSVNT